MSYKLIIQIEAWLEIQDAFDWYEEQKDGLGDEFLEELDNCYNSLTENPEGFPYINYLYRRIKTDRFPYIIMYEVDNNDIIISRVRHIKQKPV